MRRYAVVQHARDADIIGIIVGTLGVGMWLRTHFLLFFHISHSAAYLPLVSHLRNLIRRHKKKSYTLSVGKLNTAKLANFAEIECFVMVACPENSVINSKVSIRFHSHRRSLTGFSFKDFYRPIVTPFELSLALSPEPVWPGNYILDFERIMNEAQDNKHEGESNFFFLYSL